MVDKISLAKGRIDVFIIAGMRYGFPSRLIKVHLVLILLVQGVGSRKHFLSATKHALGKILYLLLF